MNEDKKTNTGGLDTAPDFENFEKADVSEELLEEANGKYRDLKGFPRYLAFGIAVATTLIIFTHMRIYFSTYKSKTIISLFHAS